MNWRTERIDWLGLLDHNKIMDRTARAFLRSSVAGGGYVSGGFARSLISVCLTERGKLPGRSSAAASRRKVKFTYDSDSWDSLANYCNVSGLTPETKGGGGKSGRFWKAGVGDIDIFFTDRHAADHAVKRGLKSEPHWHSPTLAGFGHEYLVGNAVFQHITKITGTPEEVLTTFDIANARVYADADGIHYTSEWHELENQCLLGIDNFSKPNLLWRVTKWFRKHRYLDFRLGDHAKLVDSLWSAVERTKDGSWKMWGETVQLDSVRRLARRFSDLLPPEDLLRASLLFDSYDQSSMFKRLLKQADCVNLDQEEIQF